MVLQLHVKSVLEQKDVPSTKQQLLKTAEPPTAVEFVVGPGATFKEQTATTKSAVLRTNRSKVRLLEPPEKSGLVMGGGVQSTAGPIEEQAPPVIGSQQMGVISELLERGNVLRDKMVNSLAGGTQLGHHMRYVYQ